MHTSISNRIQKYYQLSTALSSCSDDYLTSLIAEADIVHGGIGGKAVILPMAGTHIFVKRVPITKLEQEVRPSCSTANIFNLPMFYHYGVGSAGFNVWRELRSHEMTTEWVLSQRCQYFPILYHSRIIPHSATSLTMKHWKDDAEYLAYWENSPTIQTRVHALQEASAELLLFLEYIPFTLHDWLGQQIELGDLALDKVAPKVDSTLREACDFMMHNDFLHLDLHFKNILTDGEQIYISDFGLALSQSFEIDPVEQMFYHRHLYYDYACLTVNLLHSLLTQIDKSDIPWKQKLAFYVQNQPKHVPTSVKSLLQRDGEAALLMDDFFWKLQKVSKMKPFPGETLQHILTM